MKHECVGHVQKRVVAHLKKLKTASGTLMSGAGKAVKEAKEALATKKAELKQAQEVEMGEERGEVRKDYYIVKRLSGSILPST